MSFRVEPFAVLDELVVRDGTVAETRGRRAFECAIGQRHVGFADRERRRARQRLFYVFDVGKELVVRQKVPDRVWSFAFNGEHTKHSEAALELKNQVVASVKNVICQMKTTLLESTNSR